MSLQRDQQRLTTVEELEFRRALEEATPAGIAMTDLQGRQCYVNPHFCKMVGWPEDELVGAFPPYIYWPPEEIETINNAFQLTLKGKPEPAGFELRFRRRDGERFDVLVTVAPVISTQEETLRGWVASITDISAQKRMEHTIFENQTLLRAFFDSAPMLMGVIEITADADILHISNNTATERFLGFPQGGSTGQTSSQLGFPAECIQQWVTNCEESKRSGRPVRFEYSHEVQDQKLWFAATVQYIAMIAGPNRYCYISEDITDRRKAEESLRQSERLYRGIGESIDYGVWVCDPLGRNIYASQSFLDLVGMTQEQCSEFGWREVLHPDDAEATIAAWKDCVEGGHLWEREHRFLGVDGSWHHVLARGVPIKDEQGKVLCWAGINLNISSLKKTEEALRESERRLRQANQVKDDFLATLSHELRTPLTAVLGWARMLRIGQLDPQTYDRALESIERNAKAQAQLVDDLLDISKIMRGKLHLERRRFSVQEVIEAAVDSIRPAASAKGLHLELSLDPDAGTVEGDSSRLQQVIWNLLSNAVKFTSKGGQVTVELKRAGGRLDISVSDTGKGIGSDFLPYVFERFRQADSGISRKFGGLGLGLSIVKQITELHGGEVRVESAGEGKGTTFTVSLPV